MELNKIHGDSRRDIFLVKDLLEGKEFTFIKLNTGKAVGGCMHTENENYVVIKGSVRVLIGKHEIEAQAGDSGIFPAGIAHAFIAKEDSIVAEWGISTAEKEADIKDPEMREYLNKINDSTV